MKINSINNSQIAFKGLKESAKKTLNLNNVPVNIMNIGEKAHVSYPKFDKCGKKITAKKITEKVKELLKAPIKEVYDDKNPLPF